MNKAAKGHWSVENNLYWSLDVQFGEDSSRKRNVHAPENHNIMLKIAMTLLANDKTKKRGKKSKRLKSALDTKYREKLFRS